MEGSNLLDLPIEEMYKIRGASISMIFQEPMTALNPVHTVGKQIKEIFKLHRDNLDVASYDREVIDILKSVDMPSPEQRIKNYPFQLSGGMRQRVMIAMALAAHPKLLIADEPTTALDVTVQAQILALIKDLQQKNNMGVLYITHDMGVVAEISDYVAVMYAGQIVEKGSVHTIFKKPLHPYTIGLISSMPQMSSVPKSRLPSIPGNVPSPANYPATCRFAGRCVYADDYCRGNKPELIEFEAGHFVRCHKAGGLK